jgi:hypothetical protein
MSCGCGRIKEYDRNLKKEQVLELAKKEQQATGRVIVFYRCADWNFTTLKNFVPDGKKEIEYFL